MIGRLWLTLGVLAIGYTSDDPSVFDGHLLTCFVGSARPCWFRSDASGPQHHALLEQVNIGAAIHLALEHLEPVDLPLNRTGAPKQAQPLWSAKIIFRLWPRPLHTNCLRGCNVDDGFAHRMNPSAFPGSGCSAHHGC